MIDFFQYDFLQRAVIAGLVVAVVAPLIGNFMVVRGYSLMADTLAHTALAGVAVGLLLHTQPVIMAVVATVLAAIAIETLRNKTALFGESVLALFLSGSLALAVVLISLGSGFSSNVFSYLFGSITTISPSDILVIAVLGVVTVVTVLALYKELFLVSLDAELAQASGLPSRRLNTVTVILAAVTVSLSMRIVGALLIGALMVIPVLTAMQFARSFRSTIVYSIAASLVAVCTGLVLSYHFNIASGGAIVLVALACFVIATLSRRQP